MRKYSYSKITIRVISISFMIFFLFLISNISFKTVAAQDTGLTITVDDIIEANKEFSVIVRYNGSVAEDISVYIQNEPTSSTTNKHGVAYLVAPSEPGSWLIIARDESGVYGGAEATYPIKIVSEPAFWESPYFPIALAIICLIGAIVFVNLKQKKDIYNRTKELSKEKLMKIQGIGDRGKPPSSNQKKEIRVETKLESSKPYEPEPVRAKQTQDAKVEEIRISRPRKKKEVVKVEEKKDETEKVISEKRMKKRDYDWFEGTDDVRYEIGKLTGEIDEEGVDKWFEGVDGLKDKIDEKVKKKDKKKKKDEAEE